MSTDSAGHPDSLVSGEHTASVWFSCALFQFQRAVGATHLLPNTVAKPLYSRQQEI